MKNTRQLLLLAALASLAALMSHSRADADVVDQGSDSDSDSNSDSETDTDSDTNTSAWSYFREITGTSTLSGDLTDRPVLVLLDASFPYSNLDATGADLRFTTDPTGSTFDLAHHIESWNTSGESLVWVKIPTVTASGATTAYMFYGNSGGVANGDRTSAVIDMGSGGGNSVASGGSVYSGGTGGGGSRVKVFYDSSGTTSYTASVTAGSGACCGDSDYGDDGSAGTTHEAQSTFPVSVAIGVETSTD